MALIWIALSGGGLDSLAKPLGTDFVSFWSASRLALDGAPALAYDPAAHLAVQHALFPDGRDDYYAFFYPPPFLLLCLPLALLPYLPSLALWLAGGLIALLASLRTLAPRRWGLLPLLAFPGVMVNAGHGQNGFLTAACFGGCLTFMERRPFAAGLCLGALAIKPHLAVAAPFGLIAARRWAVVAGAALSASALCAASWLALGATTWRAFVADSDLARETLQSGLVDYTKMQSAFAGARLLGAGEGVAFAIQAAVSLACLAVLVRTALRRPGAVAEGATMLAATLLCTPFLLDYDLTILSLPLAWMAAEAQATNWRPWEKIVSLAAYMLPLASRPLAMATHVPIGPIVMIALMVVIARRSAASVAQLSRDSGRPP